MSLRAATRAALLVSAIGVGLTTPAVMRHSASGTLLAAWSLALVVLLSAVPVAVLRVVRPPTSAMMLWTRARLRRRTGTLARIEHEWVAIREIPREVWLAAIAAEDAYFRDHSGFDWQSIREARAHNRTHERKRGGSTITQQVAKNLFLWPARSYVRKALEAYLTLLVEALWPKRRILEVYLNVAQFGECVFGVGAASRRFFERPVAELGSREAALLAAALPSPVRYRLGAPSHELRFRQTWVLAAMRRLGDEYLERV